MHHREHAIHKHNYTLQTPFWNLHGNVYIFQQREHFVASIQTYTAPPKTPAPAHKETRRSKKKKKKKELVHQTLRTRHTVGQKVKLARTRNHYTICTKNKIYIYTSPTSTMRCTPWQCQSTHCQSTCQGSS